VADVVDDLGLPPRRSHRRNWAAPPPWAADTPPGPSNAGTERTSPADRPEQPPVWSAPEGLSSNPSQASEGPPGDGEEAAAAVAAPAFLAGRASAPQSSDPAAAQMDTPAEHAQPRGAAADDDWERAMERASADRAARRPARSDQPRVPPAVEEGVPPWERPRRYETYPSLRSRVVMPRPSMSPLVVAAVVILLLALGLFFVVPSLLNVGKPGGAGGAANPTASASTGAAPSPTPQPSPTPLVYVVRHGDTLSKIATKFGVSVDQIVEANKATVKNPDKIGEGAQLIIPTPVPSEVSGASSSPIVSPSG